jgi:cell division protein FtsI (penicillin-binding protein 3)
MRNVDPRRARWIRARMIVLSSLLTAGLFSVVASAFNIQVKHGAEWRMIAERQRQKRLKVMPMRGSILDRNGEPLAVSLDVPSAAINVAEMIRGMPEPRALATIELAAQRISSALSLPHAEVAQRLKSRRRFLWLKRRLSQQEAEALKQLADPRNPNAIKGLMIEGEGHRFYPGREALWGLVGYVSPDGVGIDGLERSLDDELRGDPSRITALRDRKGTVLFGDGIEDERAIAGDDVQLSLDLGLQYGVQEDLEAGLRAFEAKAGSAIVVDPNTGEVLAIATAPAFNPNDYGDSPIEARRHHGIADRIEPGSTMKIFTIAAAIAEGKLKPTEELFCENGAWSIGGVTIHDTHPEGLLTPSQIIQKSSNICAAKIGLSLGEAGLYGAYKRFGFGEPTGLGLPGEAAGVLRARGRPWFEVEVASAAFGQGISVTSMQLAMAMSAIANGGRLLEPILVKRVTSSTGTVVREELPTVRREAVPAAAARTVAEMMTSVVEEGGTGREAYIAGYRVAGKTATAQKADPATGKYDPDKFIASFVGFVPAQKPRFVIAVTLDEPWVAHLGGQVSAPIFRRIAMRALARYGVAPSGDVAKTPITFPLEDPTAQLLAANAAEIPLDATGPGGAVASPTASGSVRPTPLAPPSPAGASPGVAATSAVTADPSAPLLAIPDVTGLPAREAVRMLGAIGLAPVLDGSGIVQRQEPPAGGTIRKGSTIRLHLEPAS